MSKSWYVKKICGVSFSVELEVGDDDWLLGVGGGGHGMLSYSLWNWLSGVARSRRFQSIRYRLRGWLRGRLATIALSVRTVIGSSIDWPVGWSDWNFPEENKLQDVCDVSEE